MQIYIETELRGEFLEFVYACARAVAKAKARPLVHSAHPERSHQDVAHKLTRRDAGKRFVEVQNQDGVDAGGGDQVEPLRQKCEQLGSHVRIKKLRGVRVEGDGNGAHSTRARFACRASEKPLMAEVNTV